MTSIDSSTNVVKHNDTTLIEDSGPKTWDSIRNQEYLSRPNSDSSRQTQIERINGGSELIEMDLARTIPTFPTIDRPRESFDVRQKWEGYVLEVGEECFIARLVPIVGEGPDLEAEISLEEVDPSDHSLIEPGAVFYWSIGYLGKSSGICRASLIRFRRLPPLAEHDLQVARAQAVEIMSLFDGR